MSERKLHDTVVYLGNFKEIPTEPVTQPQEIAQPVGNIATRRLVAVPDLPPTENYDIPDGAA